MIKCQKCHNQATIHITEVLEDDKFEDLHFCEQCAGNYLYEPKSKSFNPKTGDVDLTEEGDETGLVPQRECSLCGIKFAEFRNSGRLGCPHDYQEFRAELVTLLENIHGETRHCGKTPRRLPLNKLTQSELIQLRNRLKQAVHREDYEEAARLRDRIKQLEES
jgi:protein arginine kinase activator